MKTLIIILLTFIFSDSYSQKTLPGFDEETTLRTAENQFKSDLKNDKLMIYTVGGLKPSNDEADQKFRSTYFIDYHDFGCTAPPYISYFSAYNMFVFKYLTERWGDEWEKDIKDNTIGFYKWTQSK